MKYLPWLGWFDSVCRHWRRGKSVSRPRPAALAVERLEGRWLPAFLPPVNYDVGSLPAAVAGAACNGDGAADLAVANALSDPASVLLGNGDGSFQPAQNFGTGSYPISLGVGDFNGGGFPDLAVANLMGGTVSVLLGNGDG